jgi:uncharacterized protein (UPF0264 family)
MRAAVAGVGFIGLVHVEALRRLGVDVVGVLAGSCGDGCPTFHDGHRQTLIGEAVLPSHTERAWLEVPR